MDTATTILILILTAFFFGGIVWIVIHSRRQRGAPARERPREAGAGRGVRRARAGGVERADREVLSDGA